MKKLKPPNRLIIKAKRKRILQRFRSNSVTNVYARIRKDGISKAKARVSNVFAWSLDPMARRLRAMIRSRLAPVGGAYISPYEISGIVPVLKEGKIVGSNVHYMGSQIITIPDIAPASVREAINAHMVAQREQEMNMTRNQGFPDEELI